MDLEKGPGPPEKAGTPLSAPLSTPLQDSSQETSQSHSITPKIAIPRVAYHERTGRPPRAKKACIACRDRRMKCSGHQPCDRCNARNEVCTYGDAKREATQKRLTDLEHQVAAYRDLLRHLQSVLQPPENELIEKSLDRYNTTATTPADDARDTNLTTDSITSWYTDNNEEDFNSSKELQAIGFIGAHSDISWMHDLKKDLEKDTYSLEVEALQPTVSASNSSTLPSVSYFLDDQHIIVHDVQASYRPSRDTASKLLDLYFSVVHPSFPVIGKQSFMQQCKTYYSQARIQPSNKWLAILNLVFAIAARHARLTSQTWAYDTDIPVNFFSRAIGLSLTNSLLFDHPDLQQVQIEGLMAFFLMSLSHINRAWRACGMALRSAVAMGINLRSESKNISNESKEIRYRVWWSLHTLEDTISMMIGRPTDATISFCTTPLPIPFDEDQFQKTPASHILSDFNFRSDYMETFMTTCGPRRRVQHKKSDSSDTTNELKPEPTEKQPSASVFFSDLTDSSYFLYFVDLTSIMRRGIGLLYAPSSYAKAWDRVTVIMEDLLSETDAWVGRLPEGFRFMKMPTSELFVRQRWSLAFRFYSARIALSRPSLCRLERRKPQDGNSATSQLDPADICISSACKILGLLPNSPNVLWLVEVSPWWCVLHYLMQALTVLLIELDYCHRRGLLVTDDVKDSITKGMSWLLAMSLDNMAAHRALVVCRDLQSRIALATPVNPWNNNNPSSCNTQDMHGPESLLTLPILPENMIMHPDMMTSYDECWDILNESD